MIAFLIRKKYIAILIDIYFPAMAVEFLINRIKALVLIIFGVFRRAMCCFRRRRRSSCESIPLSAIGIVPNNVNNHTVKTSKTKFYSKYNRHYYQISNSYFYQQELEQWTQWEDNPVVVVPDKPENIIQAKIEQYRQQVAKPADAHEEETQENFFEVQVKFVKYRG